MSLTFDVPRALSLEIAGKRALQNDEHTLNPLADDCP